MTNKFLKLILILPLFIFSILESASLDVEVQADSAILINADTGTILFEKNAKKKQYPASLTKIATAIYTLKLRSNKLDKILKAEHDDVAWVSDDEMKRSNYTLPSYWLTPGVTHIGIKKGEELSLGDLLYGLMLASGGDAGNVIARYIGGTIPVFMRDVNVYLKEIGCHDTHLTNPHGLHHPKQLSTAYDMALLTQEALKHPTFREIVKTVRHPRPQTNKQKPSTFIQGNRLMRRGKYYYSKAIGVKTGYHSLAKNNLVAAAKDGNRTLIAVIMKSPGREAVFTDAIKLFKAAFNEKKVKKRVLAAGPQRTALSIKGTMKKLKTYLKEDVIFNYYPAEEPNIKCLLAWDDLSLPVKKDQRVGELAFQDEKGKVIRREPLFAQQEVNYHFLHRLHQAMKGKLLFKCIGILLAILFVTGLLYELRK